MHEVQHTACDLRCSSYLSDCGRSPEPAPRTFRLARRASHIVLRNVREVTREQRVLCGACARALRMTCVRRAILVGRDQRRGKLERRIVGPGGEARFHVLPTISVADYVFNTGDLVLESRDAA